MKIQQQIIEILSAHSGLSSMDIHRNLSGEYSYSTTKRTLSKPVSNRIIDKSGQRKGTIYQLGRSFEILHSIDTEKYFEKDIDECVIRESFNFDLLRKELDEIDLFSEAEKEKLGPFQAIYCQNVEELSPQDYRKEIERLACETGSRAWSFPSTASDYDICLIYVHRADWYLSVNAPRDSLGLMPEDNELDFSGWELRKALTLLKKSNPPLLERIQSPILYQADEAFVEDIVNTIRPCYSRIATIHHCLSMAGKMLAQMVPGQPYKLKTFFYALRTAILCQWIVEKVELPPVKFPLVYRNLGLAPPVVDRIDELIGLKATQPESYQHTGEAMLMAHIHYCLQLAEARKNKLPAGRCPADRLNRLLRKYVRKYDH